MIFRRLAIRAARIGPEADILAREEGGKPTPQEFQESEKMRGH